MNLYFCHRVSLEVTNLRVANFSGELKDGGKANEWEGEFPDTQIISKQFIQIGGKEWFLIEQWPQYVWHIWLISIS